MTVVPVSLSSIRVEFANRSCQTNLRTGFAETIEKRAGGARLDTLTQSDLISALERIRSALENAITTSSYGGTVHKNGQEAKNAAIRSSRPIQELHSLFKDSLSNTLRQRFHGSFELFPPVGQTKPELKLAGLIKSKNQDITVTKDSHSPEQLEFGARAGEIDPVGFAATNSSLAIGVRSQLSSVEKNFDTLMERSFAETLNLRLRCPRITLGEIYLIPVQEIDDKSALHNKVSYKPKKIDLGKFVRTFSTITDANHMESDRDLYKYSATCLIIADFTQSEVKVAWSNEELKSWGYEGTTLELFKQLQPKGFLDRITSAYALANQLSPK